MTIVLAVQDPESKTAEQYSARNRFVKELTALGITFDHYGKCKYGTEVDAAQLPPPHKVRCQRPIGDMSCQVPTLMIHVRHLISPV